MDGKVSSLGFESRVGLGSSSEGGFGKGEVDFLREIFSRTKHEFLRARGCEFVVSHEF